jgi:hypothetical protein
MRTTLTLDDDVAATLERLRRARERSLKDLVNEALRLGLRQMSAPPKRSKPFHTLAVDLGPCRIGSIDSIADALAVAEGESFK